MPVIVEIKSAAEGSGNALSTRERSGKGTELDVEEANTSRLCHKRLRDPGASHIASLERRFFCKMGEVDAVTENISIWNNPVFAPAFWLQGWGFTKRDT